MLRERHRLRKYLGRPSPEFSPQADPWYRYSLQFKKNKKQKNPVNKIMTKQILRMGENLISRVTTLLDLNIHFST